MPSIFTRIIQGEIPCHKVAESDSCIAFFDISPVAVGHTLVVPKREVDRLFDLPDSDYAELMLFAKRVAAAIEREVPCNRVGVTVIGLEVPHAHVHLIPISSLHDMDFRKPRLQTDMGEMAALAGRIAAHLS